MSCKMTEVLPDEGSPATTSSFIERYDLSLDSFSSIGLPCPIVSKAQRCSAIANSHCARKGTPPKSVVPFLKEKFLFENKSKACFYLHSGLSLGRVKYSLVSLRTTGESSATAMRLGMAIIPLKVSAMLQRRSSLTVAPIMATRE